MATVELNESDHRCIFGKSDDENDFERFQSFCQLSAVEVTRIMSNICDCLRTM